MTIAADFHTPILVISETRKKSVTIINHHLSIHPSSHQVFHKFICSVQSFPRELIYSFVHSLINSSHLFINLSVQPLITTPVASLLLSEVIPHLLTYPLLTQTSTHPFITHTYAVYLMENPEKAGTMFSFVHNCIVQCHPSWFSHERHSEIASTN